MRNSLLFAPKVESLEDLCVPASWWDAHVPQPALPPEFLAVLNAPPSLPPSFTASGLSDSLAPEPATVVNAPPPPGEILRMENPFPGTMQNPLWTPENGESPFVPIATSSFSPTPTPLPFPGTMLNPLWSPGNSEPVFVPIPTGTLSAPTTPITDDMEFLSLDIYAFVQKKNSDQLIVYPVE